MNKIIISHTFKVSHTLHYFELLPSSNLLIRELESQLHSMTMSDNEWLAK